MADETVEVGLTADNRQFVKAFNDAAWAVGNVGKAYGAVSRQIQRHTQSVIAAIRKTTYAITAMTAATVVTGLEAAAKLRSLEASMANVATVADTTRLSMGAATDAVREMAREIPKTADEIAQGLYNVNSAGFQGADALQVLEASARFSVAGLTDMGSAVRGITSIMNAYQMEAGKAGYVSDTLFKAVEKGQLTAQEFVDNIGDWSASAATLNVSMGTAAAAIDSITLGGEKATTAATAFAATLRSFLKPSEDMKAAFEEMGYSSSVAALDALGYEQALIKLWEAAGQTEDGMARMFPEFEAMRGVLPLVTSQMENFAKNNKEFNTAGQVLGSTQEAMNKQMEAQANQLQLLMNEWREFRYEIAELVYPILSLAIGIGKNLLGAINDLPGPIRKIIAGMALFGPAVTVLGGIIGLTTIKILLFQKALRVLAATKIISMIPGVDKVIARVGTLGGLRATMTRFFTTMVGGSNKARIAMMKMAGKAALSVGAISAVAVMGYEFATSFGKAQRQADEFAESVGGLSTIEGPDDFVNSIAALNREIDDLIEKGAGEIGFWESLLGGFQISTPWTDNTILDDFRKLQALTEQRHESQSWQEVMQVVSSQTGMAVEEVLGYMEDLYVEGNQRLERAIEKWQEYFRLIEEGGSYEEIESAGKVALAQIPLLTMEIGKLIPVEDDAADGADDLAEELTAMQRIAKAAGTAAGDLGYNLAVMGDEASTTKDKMSALIDTIDLLTGTRLNTVQAQAAMADGFRELYTAIGEGGFSLDAMSEQGSRIIGVLGQIQDATVNYANAIYEQTGSSELANEALVHLATGLFNVASQAGLSSEQIWLMMELLNLMPADTKANLELLGGEASIQTILNVMSGLNAIDGSLAVAGLQVNVGVNTRPATGGNVGTTAEGRKMAAMAVGQAKNDAKAMVDELLSSFVNPLTTSLQGVKIGGGGGGGGGGRGGGAAARERFTLTPEQERRVAETLRGPAEKIVGENLAAAVVAQAEVLNYNTVVKRMTQGADRLSALILYGAAVTGEDPSRELEQLADMYVQAVDIIGEKEATAAINAFETLEEMALFLEKIVELRDSQIRKEDFLFQSEQMSAKEYLKILDERLSKEEEYSDAWISLWLQRDRLRDEEEEKAAEAVEEQEQRAKEAADAEERIVRNKWSLQAIDLEAYKKYLRQRLNDYEQYSDEWTSITLELQRMEERQIETLRSWKDQVRDAFLDVFNSVSDPILQATNLLAAFGDQSNVTMRELEGFYSHMQEGTRRWITAMETLKEGGVNSVFLGDLLSAGPSSLSFAESIAGLGKDGISFINESMQEIADMTNQFGLGYAQDAVGTVQGNVNNVSIRIDSVELTWDAASANLTLDDVNTAVNEALQDVVDEILAGVS